MIRYGSSYCAGRSRRASARQTPDLICPPEAFMQITARAVTVDIFAHSLTRLAALLEKGLAVRTRSSTSGGWVSCSAGRSRTFFSTSPVRTRFCVTTVLTSARQTASALGERAPFVATHRRSERRDLRHRRSIHDVTSWNCRCSGLGERAQVQQLANRRFGLVPLRTTPQFATAGIPQ